MAPMFARHVYTRDTTNRHGFSKVTVPSHGHFGFETVQDMLGARGPAKMIPYLRKWAKSTGKYGRKGQCGLHFPNGRNRVLWKEVEKSFVEKTCIGKGLTGEDLHGMSRETFEATFALC